MFCRRGATARNTVLLSAIVDIFFFYMFILRNCQWKFFCCILLLTLVPVACMLTTEKMCVTSEGISCRVRRKLLFSCSWDNIQALEQQYIYRIRCINIVPANISGIEIHDYLFSVTTPYFYFELTPRSKRIIQQVCPRQDLIQQLDKKPLIWPWKKL